MDNSLPIVRNSGIRVQEGVKKTISEFQLKAVDADTNVIISLLRNIQISKFVVKLYLVCLKTYKMFFFLFQSNEVNFFITSQPRHGVIERSNGVPVTSFTMSDIYNNVISYRHDGSNSQSDR